MSDDESRYDRRHRLRRTARQLQNVHGITSARLVTRDPDLERDIITVTVDRLREDVRPSPIDAIEARGCAVARRAVGRETTTLAVVDA